MQGCLRLFVPCEPALGGLESAAHSTALHFALPDRTRRCAAGSAGRLKAGTVQRIY